MFPELLQQVGYQELLKRVGEVQQEFGDKMQPPCSEQQLAKLKERVRSELRTELPQPYANFLRLTNGLNWNGLFIYASEKVPMIGYTDLFIQGFVDNNLNRRDDDRFEDLLVFGDDGMDIYTYRISTGEYQIYDEVPHNLIDTLPSFDALISAGLRRCLS